MMDADTTVAPIGERHFLPARIRQSRILRPTATGLTAVRGSRGPAAPPTQRQWLLGLRQHLPLVHPPAKDRLDDDVQRQGARRRIWLTPLLEILAASAISITKRWTPSPGSFCHRHARASALTSMPFGCGLVGGASRHSPDRLGYHPKHSSSSDLGRWERSSSGP
jgi:hypothetical protein